MFLERLLLAAAAGGAREGGEVRERYLGGGSGGGELHRVDSADCCSRSSDDLRVWIMVRENTKYLYTDLDWSGGGSYSKLGSCVMYSRL